MSCLRLPEGDPQLGVLGADRVAAELDQQAAAPVTAPAAAADTASVQYDPVSDQSLIAELQQGERLLWSGRPDTSRWFVPDNPPALPLPTLGVGAFAVGLAAIILHENLLSGVSAVGLFASMLGLLFAALGLYLTLGRVIARRYFGPRTAYGLTNLRALVIRPTWRGGRQTTFVWFAPGPDVHETIRRDGHGTVMIGATIYQRTAWFAGDPGWFLAKPYQRPLAAFWNIADADEVSRLAAHLIARSTRHQ